MRSSSLDVRAAPVPGRRLHGRLGDALPVDRPERWRPLLGARAAGSSASTCGSRCSTPGRARASRRCRPRSRRCADGGDGMIGLLKKHRYFRDHDLKASYDVVIIGAGAHGLATAYYLAKRHGHEEDRRARPKLHGRRRLGPQHHHHPLQLPDAGGRPLLRGQREAVRVAVAGAQLQHAVLAARPPDAGPLRPLGEHDDGAGRGEPAGRRRLAGRLPGRDQAAVPAARRQRPPHLPDPGRALPPAGRRHPPRRGGLGLRQGGRQAGRRDPPVHRRDRRSTSRTARSPASRPTAARSPATR